MSLITVDKGFDLTRGEGLLHFGDLFEGVEESPVWVSLYENSNAEWDEVISAVVPNTSISILDHVEEYFRLDPDCAERLWEDLAIMRSEEQKDLADEWRFRRYCPSCDF